MLERKREDRLDGVLGEEIEILQRRTLSVRRRRRWEPLGNHVPTPDGMAYCHLLNIAPMLEGVGGKNKQADRSSRRNWSQKA